jgi:tripartite-type tricarboxylate transporter receptor subunit TctC
VPHFLGTTFGRAAGIDLTHVAYKGAVAVDADLIGGQIAAGISALSDFLALHRAGKFRILATAGATRSPLLPDVPTFREQGFDIVVTEWYGLLAPAGTPKPIVAKLNAEMRRILALPLGERVAAIDLAPSTPDELRGFVRSEIDRWGPVIRKLGLKAE